MRRLEIFIYIIMSAGIVSMALIMMSKLGIMVHLPPGYVPSIRDISILVPAIAFLSFVKSHPGNLASQPVFKVLCVLLGAAYIADFIVELR